MSQTPTSTDPAPPPRHLLLYDGDCPICRAETDRLVRLCGQRVSTETLQSRHPGRPIPDEIKLESPDGRTFGGAEAVARTLALRKIWWSLVWIYFIPGIRQFANAAYRWIAANRYSLSATGCPEGTCSTHASQFIAATAGPSPALFRFKPTFRRSTKLFLVLFGALCAANFASMLSQIHALIGSDGLLPLADMLARVQQLAADQPYRTFPTLFWLNSSDAALTTACILGIIASLCITLGLFRRTALLLVGALSVSLIVAGQTFFYFQWDNLLIETTLLAVLLPAYSLRLFRRSKRNDAANLRLPHAIAIFLIQWLLFRVYFESGMAKVLATGRGGWREMWAMDFYYNTAPLPTWIGWYAHNMPEWWHRCEVLLTLFVELIVPVFIFAGRRFRILAFVAFSLTQIGIILTANYGIFNYLSLILGLFLLEDRDYDRFFAAARFLFRRPAPRPHAHAPVYTPSLFGILAKTLFYTAVAAPIIGASLLEFGTILVRDRETRAKISEYRRPYSRMRLVNAYHLFANMTTERIVPEFQGLDQDGNWVPYIWRYAPTDPLSPPRFAAPHQPRLDFQIWFSTLSSPFTRHTHLVRLVERLCQDPDAADRYFADDPFAQNAPRAIRVMGFRYQMTDPATRAETGDWWTREPTGQLLPPRACSLYRQTDESNPQT